MEILPGIVEGIYQDYGTKERLKTRSHADFPAFAPEYGSQRFPQIKTNQVAKVVVQYLKDPQNPNDMLTEDIKALLFAGREDISELNDELMKAFFLDEDTMGLEYLSIPQYALQKGIQFGRLPSVRPGHLVRVPLVPRGQLF